MNPEELLRSLAELEMPAPKARGSEASSKTRKQNQKTISEKLLDETIAQLQQLGAGSLSLPWELGALATAAAEVPGRAIGRRLGNLARQVAGKEPVEDAGGISPTQYMLDRAQQGAELVTSEEPKNLAQKGMRALPTAALTPGGPLAKVAIAEAPVLLDKVFGTQAQAEAPSDFSIDYQLNQTPVTVDTPSGPQKVERSDFETLGWLGAATIGAMFVPSIYGKMKTAIAPLLPVRTARAVKNAAPGTVAISSPIDLARTYDDANAGALRVAKKSGVDAATMERLQDSFRIHTRAAAGSITDNAVVFGRAEVPNLSFKVATPLSKIAKVYTPEVNQYLHLRDTFDQLQALKRVRPKQGQTTRSTIHNLDEQQVLRQINALEAANPQLRNIGKAYRENVRASRQFQATGEYATLHKKKYKNLNAESPNATNFKRNLDEALPEESALESFSDNMRARMRHRLENEAVGRYVDEVRKVNQNLFREITAKQLKDNPQWKHNTVTVYRRGVPHHYTTDPFLADVLNIDPYYFSSSWGQAFYGTKRLFEMSTTGELAPWFSLTSALRSWQIGKYTSEGLKSPTAIGSISAIPQQLIPQAAKVVGDALNRGSAGWIGNTFGQAFTRALGARLVKTYDDSFFALMQHHGSHRGAVLQQQVQNANSTWGKAIAEAPGKFKPILDGYRALLNSIHNAPAFNFARRNRTRLPPSVLAAKARHLTGDPRIGGEFSTRSGPIRLEGQNKALTELTKMYGAASEAGRGAAPWFNYTVQGIKRIGEAYLKNPMAFTGRVWLYAMMPAAGLAFYNRSLGPEYYDYQMNRRSDYKKTMYQYIGVPGRPPEEGIEFPRFHELAIASRMMEVALDHALGNNFFESEEDMLMAAQSWLSTTFSPAVPPLGGALLASQGMTSPQGVFGGESYQVQQEPFDQYQAMNKNLDLLTRAFGGGLADVIGHMYSTMYNSEDDVLSTIKNTMQAGSERVVSKAPLLRDVLNIHVPASGDTQISQELFRKQDAIRDLIEYFQKWTKEPDPGQSTAQAPGEINTKAQSAFGQSVIDQLGTVPTKALGLNQPDPTNPLYKMFAMEVYNKFQKDTPDSGGVGMRSIWRLHGDLTEHLRRIKNVNPGNFSSWSKYLNDNPDLIAYLNENNVSHTDPKAVRNFLTLKRQDVQTVILGVIRQVEAQFSEMAGREVKLEDLSPYGAQSGGMDTLDTDDQSLEPLAPY